MRDTSKALQCKRSNRTFHLKCSGLSRTEVTRSREADAYQYLRCHPQMQPAHPCAKCGKDFQAGQNRLNCGACNLQTHLGCTNLTRMGRKQAKQEVLSRICCLQPNQTPDSDDEAINQVLFRQHPPMTENRKQQCTKCKNPIRMNVLSARCYDCGATYHFVCTDLPERQRKAVRDALRLWSCLIGSAAPAENQAPPHPLNLISETQSRPDGRDSQTRNEPAAKLDSTWCVDCKGRFRRGARRLVCSQCKSPFHIQCMATLRSQANVYL